MAKPLRFRHSPRQWHEGRVRDALYADLDANLGATIGDPWFAPPPDWEAVRFDMDDGSLALFCWTDEEAYWLGNTETPSALWRTEKYTFEEVPYPVARWAQRELLAGLHDADPWLEPYPHVSWFFLPVFCSKDGRETTRAFFRDHAAGFPDASADEALTFYESVLRTGALDDYRYVMASKLGTSEYLDETRMAATMGEFDAAHLLHEAGYEVTPEIAVTTGHSIDFRADPGGSLVEVTRPLPPADRRAGTPAAAVRETAATKTAGQLEEHGGGVTLFVDCTSFPDDAWAQVRGEAPAVGHKPAVVFRVRPDGTVEGYELGSPPVDVL
ncbi:MAG: DUF5784 family protein [Halobacteriaceae archaeon]